MNKVLHFLIPFFLVMMVVIMVMVVVIIAKLKLNLKMVVFCHMCQPARNIEPFFTLWRFNLKMHRQDCLLQCDWYRGDGQNAEWRQWWWWPLMITKWWCDKQGPSKTFESPRLLSSMWLILGCLHCIGRCGDPIGWWMIFNSVDE